MLEAEGRAVSVSPKPGEKRSWDATGGIDREMEVTCFTRVAQTWVPAVYFDFGPND